VGIGKLLENRLYPYEKGLAVQKLDMKKGNRCFED